MVYSLEMVVEMTRSTEGVVTFEILAPWLTEPVKGSTFEEAYERALRARLRSC